MDIQLCSKCVNLLELTEGLFTCDYDYFEDITENKMLISTPEMFDCQEYEEIKS